MGEGFEHDVFLSYNSANRAEVELIAERLRDEHGLRVFFDAWAIVPGDLVVGVLDAAIDRSRTVAVFLGPEGLGPWQDEERQIGLAYAVKLKRRVIPALLPGAVEDAVPGFLRTRAWVALGNDDGLARLVVGITRQTSEGSAEASRGTAQAELARGTPAMTTSSKRNSLLADEGAGSAGGSDLGRPRDSAHRRERLINKLYMLGPDLIFHATPQSTSSARWELEVEEVLIGEWGDLEFYCASFAELDDATKFVVAETGVGRVIADAPVLKGHRLHIPVAPPAARSNVKWGPFSESTTTAS